MGFMVLCRTFYTAPEQGQGPTPTVPIVLVLVPVPVLVSDTAGVITPYRFVYIEAKAKETSVPEEFIDNRFNVHIEQRQKSKKENRLCTL